MVDSTVSQPYSHYAATENVSICSMMNTSGAVAALFASRAPSQLQDSRLTYLRTNYLLTMSAKNSL